MSSGNPCRQEATQRPPKASDGSVQEGPVFPLHAFVSPSVKSVLYIGFDSQKSETGSSLSSGDEDAQAQRFRVGVPGG